MNHDRTHSVYVIACSKKGKPASPVKVGFSHSPNARLRELQTASPSRLILLCTFEFPNRQLAKDVEFAFHHCQSGFRAHGEWFDIEPIDAVVRMCANVQAALNHWLSDNEPLLDAAWESTGLQANIDLLSEWKASIGGNNG